jgi:uncharacterized protein (TIGR02118 family)
MAVLSVLYPDTEGGRFDEAYYRQHHIPLVRERWGPMGLVDIRLLRGIGALDGGPAPYRIMAFVTFKSVEALRQALASHKEEVFASIKRYTDIVPVMQVSEAMSV